MATKMRGWEVFLDGVLIDTVFFVAGMNLDDVKLSLITHDNYDPSIIIVPESERLRTTFDNKE